ncbi:MAG: ABATE domain-containing protein [Acidobacteriia bacterium]|nr:ABATE domain-containing protein [Terriglobia bacterium]
MTPSNSKSRFEFTGGNLCLDFANTIDNRASENPKDLLTAYTDLVEWGTEAGVLPPTCLQGLYRLALDTPGHAQTAVRHAVHLRDAIYTIFAAVADRRGISGAALAALNVAVQDAGEHARIAHTSRRFAWEWVLPGESLNSVLWPVARAAADLLVSDDLAYVRQCASSDCTWLFLDKTKNHRRRWCEMRTCGNRDKARRYYARKKK